MLIATTATIVFVREIATKIFMNYNLMIKIRLDPDELAIKYVQRDNLKRQIFVKI